MAAPEPLSFSGAVLVPHFTTGIESKLWHNVDCEMKMVFPSESVRLLLVPPKGAPHCGDHNFTFVLFLEAFLPDI